MHSKYFHKALSTTLLLSSLAACSQTTPVPTPVVTPLPSPSASPTPVPSASPTPTATPLPLPQVSVEGRIFDDTETLLEDVIIQAVSLSSGLPYTAEVSSKEGRYLLKNVPAGAQIELTAQKEGFTQRRRLLVTREGEANILDFGAGPDSNGSQFDALSDKPEVISVSPTRHASDVSYKTAFTVQFSEPVDRESAEKAFTLRSFNKSKLTVDHASSEDTFTGNSDIAIGDDGSPIWDKEAFDLSWNAEGDALTLSFKNALHLPADTHQERIPDYRVSFYGLEVQGASSVLKDLDGNIRKSKHFKLTDGAFEDSYKFTLKADNEQPELKELVAETDENAGQYGDALKLYYSKRMILHTRSRVIAGGMADQAGAEHNAPAAYPGSLFATAEKAAYNYNLDITPRSTGLSYSGSWGALGGRAVYNTSDLNHQSVLLLPPFAMPERAAGNSARPAGEMVHLAITYSNGSQEQERFFLESNTYASLENQIETLFSGNLHIQEVKNVGTEGQIESGDRYQITLDSGAHHKVDTHLQVAAIKIFSTGAFAEQHLNGPGEFGLIFPGHAAGARLDLFQPGDTLRVDVKESVLDPSGNKLKSGRNSAVVSAS